MGLRPLLMGPPLNERDSDPTLTTLDSHLEAVAELLPQVYGDSEASQQAQMNFTRLLTMESGPRDYDGVVCKRAALLPVSMDGARANETETGRQLQVDSHSAPLPA